MAVFEEASHDSPSVDHLYRKIVELHSYFLRTWINGHYAREEWNYFTNGLGDTSTTNAAESTNWRFTVKTGSKKPNIYISLNAIKSNLNKAEKVTDLVELDHLQNPSRSKKTSVPIKRF